MRQISLRLFGLLTNFYITDINAWIINRILVRRRKLWNLSGINESRMDSEFFKYGIVNLARANSSLSNMTPYPSENKALVVERAGKLAVKQIPFPIPERSDVIVHILATYVNPVSKYVLQEGGHFLPGSDYPFVWGCQAVGRIAATGGDEVYVKKGDLVVIDNLLRARDVEEVTAIQGLFYKFTPDSKKLMNMYKDGFYAQHAKVPLENVHVLNEDVLLGQFGYKMEELPQISRFAVGLGGLNRINLKPGEIVVIAPSTGQFSGDAVEVASAMGATVVAASRNKAILEKLSVTFPRVHALQLTGDVQKDAEGMQRWGVPDAFLDFTPASTSVPSHLTSAIQAVKPRGRLCMLGSPQGNVEIPYAFIMFKNLEFYFNFMYKREDQQQVVRMAENGLLPLDERAGQEVTTFSVEEWEKAFDFAQNHGSWGSSVALRFQ